MAEADSDMEVESCHSGDGALAPGDDLEQADRVFQHLIAEHQLEQEERARAAELQASQQSQPLATQHYSQQSVEGAGHQVDGPGQEREEEESEERQGDL